MNVASSDVRTIGDSLAHVLQHTLTHRYKHNFSTSAGMGRTFSNAYVWLDWWSQPQPTMEKIGTPERAQAEQDLAKALSSTSAYIERCDCMVMPAPGALHRERVSPRTTKGICLLSHVASKSLCVGTFASYLSRRQTFPVRSVGARSARILSNLQ